MEINQVYNRELKENLVNAAIGVLMDNKQITNEDFPSVSISMGYLFTTEDQQVEGLFQIGFSGKTYYFAAQKGKLMMVSIDESMFQQTVAYMEANHPCLKNDELPETKLQKKRREKNNKIVSKKKISVAEKLMTRWNDDEINLKDKETICKRMIACFYAIQIACDVAQNNYEESLKYFKSFMEKFGVEDQLNSKEKRIIDGTYSQQDAIDLDWAYEAFWALCWCLGFVRDISDAGKICDCQKAMALIQSCESVQNLVKKAKLRSKEEILDVLDLYFRYNWAINDAKVNPNASIGNLNPSIVIERRRGLEWVVSEVEDWYDLTFPA